MTFSDDNTNGYSRSQLDRANKIFDALDDSNDDDLEDDELKRLQEQILEHVEFTGDGVLASDARFILERISA